MSFVPVSDFSLENVKIKMKLVVKYNLSKYAENVLNRFFWNNLKCNLPSDSCEEAIKFFIKAIEHGAIDIAWTTTYAAQSSPGLIDEKAAKCVEVFLLKNLHKIKLITN